MWQLVKEKEVPIYMSIVELILKNIHEGKILPGERLPSERKLATYLSVNRSTVVHAMDELVTLGWITRKQGSGTIVNEEKWGITTTPRTDWRHYLEKNVFTNVHPLINEIEQQLKQEKIETIDLYTGELPIDLIPSFSFSSLNWKDFLWKESQDDLGYLPLREVISQMFIKEKGIIVNPNNFLITSGGQQALFLILQVLLKAGDSVVIENPSFFYSLPIFQAAGIRLYGVPMDKEGICIKELEKIIRKYPIKMLMVNPSFQNPTGKTMSLKRRKELINLCRKYQLPILEDDVFDQLKFTDDVSLPSLKKLSPESVLYIGSLSKILGSTTKIGWLCAPVTVTKQLAMARKIMDFSLSIFPQVLATKALLTADFTQKIGEVEHAVKQRGKLVHEVINQMDEWKVNEPMGGFYLWATWNKGSIPTKAWQIFLEEELLVMPGSFFGDGKNSLRINFSRLPIEKITIFQQKLAFITKKMNDL